MKLIVTFEAEIDDARGQSTWPTVRLGRCIDVRQAEPVLLNAVQNGEIVPPPEPGPNLRLEEGWPWICSGDALSGEPHAHAKSGQAEWRDPSPTAEAERQRQR